MEQVDGGFVFVAFLPSIDASPSLTELAEEVAWSISPRTPPLHVLKCVWLC